MTDPRLVTPPGIDDLVRGVQSRLAFENALRSPAPAPRRTPAPYVPLPTTPVELAEPTVVPQGDHYWHCWAASAESWQEVMGRTTVKKRAMLVREFSNAPAGALNAMYQLGPGVWKETSRFGALMKYLRMNHKYMKPTELTPGEFVIKELNAQFVATHLHAHGYLLLFFNLRSVTDRTSADTGPSHTIVVYGINYPNGGWPIKIKYMDPWDEGSLKEQDLTDFQKKTAVIVAWPK